MLKQNGENLCRVLNFVSIENNILSLCCKTGRSEENSDEFLNWFGIEVL